MEHSFESTGDLVEMHISFSRSGWGQRVCFDKLLGDVEAAMISVHSESEDLVQSFSHHPWLVSSPVSPVLYHCRNKFTVSYIDCLSVKKSVVVLIT